MSKIILATVTGAFLLTLTCVAAKRKRQGTLSDCRIYNRALTDEIVRIAQEVADNTFKRRLGRNRFGTVVAMGAGM